MWFLLFVAWQAVCRSQNDDFLWGTATASYQVEGAVKSDGRLPSIWDTFCETSGKVYNNESGEVADDNYDRFVEDIALMKALNFKNYRMSIAWPRILPDGETVNAAGIEHYAKVIDTLLANDIQPFITLYHWDLPQSVFDKTNGGWINESIVDYYVRYADVVWSNFHLKVRKWITFNEAVTFCVQGYDSGTHAPGRCTVNNDRNFNCPLGDSSTEVYLCAHNVLLSHAAAVKLFRSKYSWTGSEVGMTNNCNWAEPASESQADIDAAQRNVIWQLGWFADPLYFGDYPQVMKDYIGDRLPQFTDEQKADLKGSHNFFGLNHYTTTWVKDESQNTPALLDWWTDQKTSSSAYNQYNGSLIGPQAESAWLYVYGAGMYKILHWISDRYNNPPIFLTENGVDVPGESSMPLEEALDDTFRINFYQQYIGNATKAKSEGVDLRGYVAWSMMDNFEWADGYTKRFGLHYVDYNNNLTRYAKQSAYWFANYSQNNPEFDYNTHLQLSSTL